MTPTGTVAPATPIEPVRRDGNSPKAVRGEYRKSKRTRAAILHASLEVFAESGYHKGSLRQIADRVGMSEAGMLHHFRSKSALLLAMLQFRDEQSRSFLPDASTGRDTLRALVDIARDSESKPGVVRTYTLLSAEATAEDHPAHDYFINRYIEIRGRITDAFNAIRDEGGLRADVDPLQAAVATVALWDGLQVQWLMEPTIVDLPRALQHHLDSYLVHPLTSTTGDPA